jgi:UDP-GlcNAc:undecaprenyl-phosphate GlcNAc-1-phosphate transferase
MRIESMVFCLILGGLISALIIPVMLLPDLMHSIQLRKGKKKTSAGSPRFGGVALVLAFLGVVVLSCLLRPSVLTGSESVTLHLIWGALAMVFLGVWNDYRHPGTIHLLVLQALVAAGLFAQGIQLESFEGVAAGVFSAEGLSSLVITVFWIVGLTNLPRLMDKVTGLAGSVGGLGLVLVTLAAYWSEASLVALWGAGMTGALAGFLFYNLPPSRVRLGGAGSSLIGFLLGSMTILAAGRTSAMGASVIPFFVVMLLILSAGFAVLRRDLGAVSLLSSRRAGQGQGLPQRGVKPHAQ